MNIRGSHVTLRPATNADVAALARIRSKPEVYARWRGDDIGAEIAQSLTEVDMHMYVIEQDGRTVGAIQWYAEEDPDYRHAGIDIFLDPEVHGRGLGTDAVRAMSRFLIETEGHHRLVIDPAVDNAAAIAAYGKAGFRPVGVMRQYERGPDGSWHDGLLMELLADEFERPVASSS